MDKNSNNEKKYREISPVEEDAKEGLLFKSWKSDWGLKISTWYGMDKIKFAFIEIGAGGKGPKKKNKNRGKKQNKTNRVNN